MARGRAGATTTGLRRVLAPATACWRCVDVASRSPRPGSATRSTRPTSTSGRARLRDPSTPRSCADSSSDTTSPSPARSVASSARSPRPRLAAADAPPPAGRRRLGQDRRGADRAAGRRSTADARVRSWPRPRSSPNSTSRRCARTWRGCSVADPAVLGGERHSRSNCSPVASRPRTVRRCSTDCASGVGRHRRGHARALDRRRALSRARRDRHRRAASLRRRAARGPARQGSRALRRGRRPRPAGHDRDADPAHRGDGGLRRPRPIGARRDARGRRPITTDVGARATDEVDELLAARARRGGRRAARLRDLSAGRGLRARRGDERGRGADPPRARTSCADSRSDSCTDR